MQRRSRTPIRIAIILAIVIGFWIISPNASAQKNLNTITLDNQSGKRALVKVVGPSKHTVEVANGTKESVPITGGKYYLLIRYGESEDEYWYAKGESFDVIQTETQYTSTTITLYKVSSGNHESKRISAKEFEEVIVSSSNQGKPNYNKNVKYSPYFVPQSSGIFKYSKEGYPLSIKNTQNTGYMAVNISNDNTESGLMDKIFIYESMDVEGEKSLFVIGTIDLNYIKEIEILEQHRDYRIKSFHNMSLPYFNAKIKLKNDEGYTVSMLAFDLVEAKNEPLQFNRSKLFIENGAIVHRVKEGTQLINHVISRSR